MPFANSWRLMGKKQSSHRSGSRRQRGRAEPLPSARDGEPSVSVTPPQQRNSPARSAESRSETIADNALLSINPGTVLMALLMALIIFAGHLAAPYVAEPSSVPLPWRLPIAGLLAVVAGLSTATLTCLAYSLVFLNDLAGVKRFSQAVGQYAAMGAILGTLLGLRMAVPLLNDSVSTHHGRLDFTAYISTLSNTATIFTLVMISACWWRIMGFFLSYGPTTRQKWWARAFLAGGNWFGFQAGSAVWSMLT